VLAALISPNELNLLTAEAFVRIPVEALLGIVLVLLLRGRVRTVAAVLFGLALGVLSLVKILDMAFYTVLARRFDPVLDFPLLGAALGVLSESIGRAGATVAAAAAVILAAALLVLLPLAVVRLTRLVVRHDRTATGTAGVLGIGWVVCALLSVQVVPGVPVAAVTSERLLQVGTGWHDLDEFAEESAVDAFGDTPAADLLTALDGKDVILAYVESYGRDAIEQPPFAAHLRPVLAAADRRLGAAGYASRSGFLTSPTAGGGSWLAHATVQSGLWISNQRRYRTLVDSDRLTLSGAFRRAGWRTVGVMPGLTREWPEGGFFGYDRVYAPPDLGYRGPPFTAGTMPDQYTVAAFHRAERSEPEHRPVMAELPLVSSHAPFAPLPRLLDWDDIGDGSVFAAVAAAADPPGVVWRDLDRARLEYARSVEYTLATLISYVEVYGGDDLVLIMLGDHQAAPLVIGNDAGKGVPISIVARDPAVLDRISGWGWHDGLRPGPDAPVWRMDTFRDRFLGAFSPQAGPHPLAARPTPAVASRPTPAAAARPTPAAAPPGG
jgi:hypothetical protein